MNHLKILKGVSLIILLLCACTEDYDILTNKSRDIDIKSDLDIARNWYNQQQIAHGMETRSDNLDVNPIPVLSDSPSWEFYAINRNDSLLVVDVDLTDRVCQDFVTKENWDFYQQTKEWKYRRSYTRFVYMKNYKTNTETGFLMTIIPSKFYTKTHADRINKNTYLHRDKYLFGSVLFHDLNGKFVNGWKYERGKVVSKIRKKRWDDFPDADRLVFRSIPARFEVTPQLYTPPATRTGMEDDPLYDGGTFPDIIVTPDPKPDWGDYPPGGGWVEHPDDNYPNNNEDGYNHDNDGYINEPHDGGSGGYNPPPLIPPAKGKDFESKVGDKIVVPFPGSDRIFKPKSVPYRSWSRLWTLESPKLPFVPGGGSKAFSIWARVIPTPLSWIIKRTVSSSSFKIPLIFIVPFPFFSSRPWIKAFSTIG